MKKTYAPPVATPAILELFNTIKRQLRHLDPKDNTLLGFLIDLPVKGKEFGVFTQSFHKDGYDFLIEHSFSRDEEGNLVFHHADLKVMKHRVVKSARIVYGTGEQVTGYIVDPETKQVDEVTMKKVDEEVATILDTKEADSFKVGKVKVFTSGEPKGRFKYDGLPVYGKAIFIPVDDEATIDKEAFADCIKFN